MINEQKETIGLSGADLDCEFYVLKKANDDSYISFDDLNKIYKDKGAFADLVGISVRIYDTERRTYLPHFFRMIHREIV